MTATVQRERATRTTDGPKSVQRRIAPIVALSDPIGVLSILVDADPALAAGPRPAWQAPVRSGLRRVVREARRRLPRAGRLALEARLDELEPELDSLLDPRAGCRGRALFAAVGAGDVHRVGLRAPLDPHVSLGPRAVVLQLVAAEQDVQPAGVATVSWARFESSEWEPAILRPLDAVELAEADHGRGMRGTNPTVPQPFPERDRFESAVGARVAARLREAGARLSKEAETRGWDVLVADGDPRLVDALAAAFRAEGCELVRSPQPIAGLPEAAAAERVGTAVRERRAARIERLLAELDGSAAATRDRALVERALSEGRVEHLLLAQPLAGAPPEPVSESLLRRAVETGAEVTVVHAGVADLGPGGTAALLRW